MIDFNKPSLRNDHPIIGKLEGISYEDKRFLKIMEKETCKMGNHYQIPLLLQDEKMTLPINRRAAEKRLPYAHVWNTVVTSGLVPPVATWNC